MTKSGDIIDKKINYILKPIDSARFMPDNPAGDINENKYEECIDKRLEYKKKSSKTKYKDCKCYLEYVKIKDKILQLKCLKCNKNHENNSIEN